MKYKVKKTLLLSASVQSELSSSTNTSTLQILGGPQSTSFQFSSHIALFRFLKFDAVRTLLQFFNNLLSKTSIFYVSESEAEVQNENSDAGNKTGPKRVKSFSKGIEEECRMVIRDETNNFSKRIEEGCGMGIRDEMSPDRRRDLQKPDISMKNGLHEDHEQVSDSTYKSLPCSFYI